MAAQHEAAVRLAGLVRHALEEADLETYADLLAADVRWGPPGDPSPPCQSRWQVLTVCGGQITSITGYDNRDEAAATAGLGGVL